MTKAEEKYKEWQNFEPNLRLADIILVHRNKGAIVRSIQKRTNSYWNHVALVFFTPEKKHAFNNYLIIEANLKGIEIHRIQKYSHHFDEYDIGVKRFPGLDDEKRRKILAFFLNYLDSHYDMTRLVGFWFRIFMNKAFNRYQHRIINKDEFICSTFTQKSFYQAFPPEEYKKALFKEVEGDILDLSSLEEINPADIANTKKLKWVFNENRPYEK
ncbi:hypothetical protein KKC88_02895 [Patescibacteria group bacterium]|nr:hypothetical protein [Patescibacteria group bacterium]MBU1673819.1 hypothetical protein [Patescibacteria group bacterium]MBU1964066.1 hypothetical protein [Patescibacteria group bacterium]